MKGYSHCDFCNEFSEGHDNAFSRRYGIHAKDRTVLETENFRVVPSLGQIVEGHILVVPLRHHTALADMSPEPTAELVELTDRVRVALSVTYGPCVCFEHGTRSEDSGGCGIYHAHLHAVPLSAERDPTALLREEFPLKRLGSIREIAIEAKRATSYLYYEDLQSNKYLVNVDYLPSQYMRRVLAKSVGNCEWDWRKYGREEALLSTVARLAQAFGTKAGSPQPHSVQSLG